MEEIIKLLIKKGYRPRFIDYSKNAEDRYLETALAIKWIRENFGIHIFPDFGLGWESIIVPVGYSGDGQFLKDGLTNFKTPEEATEAALLYTLKNLIS